jgi:hypothetical protein
LGTSQWQRKGLMTWLRHAWVKVSIRRMVLESAYHICSGYAGCCTRDGTFGRSCERMTEAAAQILERASEINPSERGCYTAVTVDSNTFFSLCFCAHRLTRLRQHDGRENSMYTTPSLTSTSVFSVQITKRSIILS